MLKINFVRIDKIWIALLTCIAICYCFWNMEDSFSCSVLLSGVICVGLIAIGRREGYLIGLYNSLAYSQISYLNNLNGEVILNLGFYIPTGLAGYLLWRSHQKSETVIMRSLPWKKRGFVFCIFLVLFLITGYQLSRIDSQNSPYIDASTNALSIIATFLMMWRYKEQWVLYIVLNVITVIMWFIRWYEGGFKSDTMIVMWGLYLANSVFGYWRWHMGSKLNHESS